jgi:hypothetical protein
MLAMSCNDCIEVASFASFETEISAKTRKIRMMKVILASTLLAAVAIAYGQSVAKPQWPREASGMLFPLINFEYSYADPIRCRSPIRALQKMLCPPRPRAAMHSCQQFNNSLTK